MIILLLRGRGGKDFAIIRTNVRFASGIADMRSLAEILLELRDIWNRRYADEEFVTDFLGHCKDIRHQKALLVLRGIMDEILKYFPELTVRQAKEWVIKECYAAVGGAKLCGYVSLLTNKARRAALLGF